MKVFFRNIYFFSRLHFVFVSVLLLLSCNDNAPYKPFSLKDLADKTDSINHYNDSISVIRENLNADYKEKALEAIFDTKSKNNHFNGCVLVAQQGYILFKKAYGYANYEEKIKLTTSTPFELASTSKTLTAAGIMLLKQQGKLSYDDNVKKYIPGFPYDDITIKLLLTHRSGLPNYMYFCDSLYTEQEKLLTNDDVLLIMQVHQPPVYAKANKKFEYCNTNYCLLSSIIERVSEMSYPEFMKTNIFEPLGMDSTFVKAPEDSLKKTVIAYHGDWKIEDGDFLDGVYGDKGIYSSVEDLFKWDQALYNYTLLKKETLDEAFKGYSHEKAGTHNYGLGFRIIEQKDGSKTVYHNGWWHCFNATFYRRLNDKSTIIILSNKLNKSIYQTADIFSILGISNEEILQDNE